jgi:rubrerythrin
MMYSKESLHRDAFAKFAEMDGNPKLRKLLTELSREEVRHARPT